jgi:hypothetical protein
MLLGVTAVRYESLLSKLPLLYMSAIAAVESEDNGLSKAQRRYAGTSLDVLVRARSSDNLGGSTSACVRVCVSCSSSVADLCGGCSSPSSGTG